MIFLTYNDAYSGIYQSQVIDVCHTLEQVSGEKVRLIALVSIRNYFRQRTRIKAALPAATVLPMFPGVTRWRFNAFPLAFFTRLFTHTDTVFARGPFAANLALTLKKKGLAKQVIFDARGAYLAEFNEYELVRNDAFKKEIAAIEAKALRESDKQLAVSEQLVQWWKEQYGFTASNHVVIPCTLAEHFDKPLPSKEQLLQARNAMGYDPSDTVLVYSGSGAGWQSFALVDDLLFRLFSASSSLKLIFLSKDAPKNSRTFAAFRKRIHLNWVDPAEVRNVLLAADYGLLVREKSITNKVASPVKFAEYLACGLDVIISEDIGDFTEFVKQHKCGLIAENVTVPPPVSYEKKLLNASLARAHFSKQNASLRKRYAALLTR